MESRNRSILGAGNFLRHCTCEIMTYLFRPKNLKRWLVKASNPRLRPNPNFPSRSRVSSPQRLKAHGATSRRGGGGGISSVRFAAHAGSGGGEDCSPAEQVPDLWTQACNGLEWRHGRSEQPDYYA